ncbi:TolB family protein, partial [Steroidobacter sp.]|uniref:TolB family protein n=1 Tax=Steroidobacter sp. TaxID=1978227 RepID=UPI001A3CA99A
FVGVEPFRVLFAGDEPENGSNELYLSDLVSDPTVLTTATEGNWRLRGFKASQNGATVAYRREDQTNAARVDLGFVRIATTIQRSTVPVPAGATLPLDVDNADQFIVSPDGQWIALIARVGSVDSVYVYNVTTGTALSKVSPANTVFASHLRFSYDSRNLFFLASPVAGGGAKSLYTVTAAGPSATVPVSAISDPATTDDVFDFSISPNQLSILINANRNGRQALFYIDARQLQAETQVSHSLAFGESISASTISSIGGTIGSGMGQRVGYTVRTAIQTTRAYVAEISTTPNPREVATAAEVVGLRPDDDALLYTKSGQIYERDLDTGADAIVAAGGTAWYDSTGNILLVRQAQFSGSTPYPVLAVTTRGAFGTTDAVGTPAQAARLNEVSGFDRGVTVLAEGPPGGSTPTRARVALVNGLAPDKLLYLSDFPSPLQLTSSTALVVTR